MEWTTERRYRRYEDWTQEEINKSKKTWLSLHGILITSRTKARTFNDPNGFSYFDGKWVVFTKTFPLVQLTV